MEKNVPNLRFKEFTGEWEYKKLGDECEFFSGGTPKVGVKEYYNGSIPFIKSGEINSNETEYYLSEDGLRNSSAKMVKQGDLLYALYGATSGEVGISKINGAINQAILCIRPLNIETRYLSQLLKLKKENIVRTYIQGGQGNLSAEIVKELIFAYPKKEEQIKISNFLSIIDSRIANQSDKVDSLKELKKGIMQKIFSQQIRFKRDDREEYPEWVEAQIKDVLKIKHGRSQKLVEDTNGEYPILGTGGLMGYSREFLWNKPSVLIGRKGTIDKPQFMEVPFWTVDTLFYTDIFDGIVPKFIYYLFQTINWKQYNEASGVPSLSASTLEAIEISYPIEEEQEKIADLLSTLDSKIDIETRIFSTLQTLKKALLKQMFV